MPPSAPASGGKFRRILVAALIFIAFAAFGLAELGPFLAKDDPPRNVDAILVLSGSSMARALEAADLYNSGYSPMIVLTRQTRDGGERALLERGIEFPEDVDRVREVFLKLRIPSTAIIVPERIHNSTAAEAMTLRGLAASHGWREVMIVTSKYHLRRAAFAIRRELRGTGVQITMRGTRYDDADPANWWRRRADIRDVMIEVPKLVAYLLGLRA